MHLSRMICDSNSSSRVAEREPVLGGQLGCCILPGFDSQISLRGLSAACS